jgi:predicted nucleic acid-binding protein
MRITIDTSVVLAVVLNEPEKAGLIEITQDADLVAPISLHWEIGNAFSLMFKKRRITYKEALAALKAYQEIPIETIAIDIENALEISHDFNIYAYDAYMLACAAESKSSLLTLDRHLIETAKKMKIRISGGGI